ncbi:phosphopantetheine-binding protein [Streptomyces griseoincarnatus]|uniref:Phosphopantetheine-binding protein n=1 Tax=Streptomyces griseoincarnatus TaxID=29305 RepID=A0ABT0W2R1_STRGI|nr:phosphopantetheine-binding protein [Streptomyces griseoincarnatus]MCM2517550.1 phosphopantetheine-binding protein [Streptomyces griseoincarnatus]
MESSPQMVHERGGQEETSQPQAGPSGASAALAQEIAELWGEHLGSPGVGPQDDFFALGGNSLAGIKIIERVLLDHGVRLSVRDFYLAGTPAKVAELIEQGRAGT